MTGGIEAWVSAIATDWRTADLTEPDRLLCEFAERLAKSSLAIADPDIERLRGAGFDDQSIHDAVQVIAYFCYINRVADALGVDEEAWLDV